ncbi:MAG: acetolactate synthase small subunit [Acidobacteriaceae bacterium]|nr:acetolactate synthase small subunit [Acidobacteriaceae bacterium]MBV9780017.1 acetolactate synthase small subunit [Acidobacteriaceae bacterium]
MQQIISLLMENKPGALMRVTGVLTQRGYNIESLTVAHTVDPTLSRMTITVDVDAGVRAQVIKQMNRLINVLQATDVTDGPAANRELVLLRVRSGGLHRTAILDQAKKFHARVLDSTSEGFLLEATGDPKQLDQLVAIMSDYGRVEATRSGIVSMSLERKKLRLSAPVARRPAQTVARPGAEMSAPYEMQETE